MLQIFTRGASSVIESRPPQRLLQQHAPAPLLRSPLWQAPLPYGACPPAPAFQRDADAHPTQPGPAPDCQTPVAPTPLPLGSLQMRSSRSSESRASSVLKM